MADELRLGLTIRYTDGNLSYRKDISSITVDVAAAKYVTNVQTVGTSEEAIALGDVAAPGYAFFRNLDATNYVEIRPATGEEDCIKLLAGDIALLRLADSAPYAIANTASVELEYTIFDT